MVDLEKLNKEKYGIIQPAISYRFMVEPLYSNYECGKSFIWSVKNINIKQTDNKTQLKLVIREDVTGLVGNIISNICKNKIPLLLSSMDLSNTDVNFRTLYTPNTHYTLSYSYDYAKNETMDYTLECDDVYVNFNYNEDATDF